MTQRVGIGHYDQKARSMDEFGGIFGHSDQQIFFTFFRDRLPAARPLAFREQTLHEWI